jgi:hypothetical protein
MFRSLHERVTRPRRLGLWLAALAALAHLWLPVLHAQHGGVHAGAPAGIIPAELHGEPCRSDVTGSGSEPAQLPGSSVSGSCECLTCKVLQTVTLPPVLTAESAVVAEYAPLLAHTAPQPRASEVALPPSRAPPLS